MCGANPHLLDTKGSLQESGVGCYEIIHSHLGLLMPRTMALIQSLLMGYP